MGKSFLEKPVGELLTALAALPVFLLLAACNHWGGLPPEARPPRHCLRAIFDSDQARVAGARRNDGANAFVRRTNTVKKANGFAPVGMTGKRV
jgi:hypothetical protein